MYENRHGRFTAVDPLLASGKSPNPQTFNRFVYVLNNPLILTDPDGLQVGTAAGKVYQRGNSFAIFRGKPYAGYKPVTRTINAQTTIGRVQHYLTVTPGGWTIGDRIDNLKFASPTAPVSQGPPVENAAIRALATGVSNGVYDGTIGTLKGIGNAPAVGLNGVTGTLLNHGPGTLYFQGTNPLAVPLPFAYNNARQASYGSAGSTGTLFGAGLANGVFAGVGSSLPLVPQNTSLFRAVSRAELDDIANFGGFRPNPNMQGYQEVKLFATSADDAAQFGRNNFGLDRVPNFIVQTEAPSGVMNNSFRTTMDSMNAVTLPSEQLSLLRNTRVCIFSPNCR